MSVTSSRERIRKLFDATTGDMVSVGGGTFAGIYPALNALRESGPVHSGTVAELLGDTTTESHYDAFPGPRYSCFSFETCDRVFRDVEFFSSAIHQTVEPIAFGGPTILGMDEPEHRRYRALVQKAFSPANRGWWSNNWINGIVEELITHVLPAGRADLSIDLCAQMPLHTITASFGLDAEAGLEVREEISRISYRRDLTVDDRRASGDRVDEILAPIVRSRRSDPQDDLISVLTQAELDVEGVKQTLTDRDIMSFARLMLTAGSGTTWRQLGNTIFALLHDAEAFAAVQADRSLLSKAIEETLRWEGTDPFFRRLVVKDTELGSVNIAAGAVVEVCLGAANRDPARWDAPDEWQLDRTVAGHMTFALGPHSCLGRHLAREEMTVALNAILDRLPNLRLDPDAPAPFITGLEHRGPSALPVLFDAVPAR